MSRVAIWIANGALFVLCCFLTANLVNGWLSAWLAGEPAAGPPPQAAAPPRAPQWSDRQIILRRNLFQVSTLLPQAGPSPEDEKLEATKLPLKLLGTVAASDPAQAWAAVENTQQRRTIVVRPQDHLLDRATVVRVERRRLVLENNGHREELALDEDAAAALLKPPIRPATANVGDLRDRIQRLSQDRYEVPRDGVENLMRNPAELFSQARILPKYQDGSMVGIQLNSIQPGSLFDKIGIKDGDVVTQVNGKAISSPQDSVALLQELSSADQFQVNVLGSDGQQRTLSYEVQP
jgi:general secretion pathway protein C